MPSPRENPSNRTLHGRRIAAIHPASRPQVAERFLREIKVQASLSHPNIASLHTALRYDNQLLLVMEFVARNPDPA